MVAALEIQPDALLTYEEAALELGKSRETIKGAVSRGVLQAVKLPGDRRKYLRRQDVEYFRDKPMIVSLARTPVAPHVAPESEPLGQAERVVRAVADAHIGMLSVAAANLTATYSALFRQLPPSLAQELQAKLPEIMHQSMAMAMSVVAPIVGEHARHGAVTQETLDQIEPMLTEAVSKVGPPIEGEQEVIAALSAMFEKQLRASGVPIITEGVIGGGSRKPDDS